MKTNESIPPNMRVEALEKQHDFFCYLVPVASFPVPAMERDSYVNALSRLEDSLVKIHGGSRETLLQVWKLHHDGASKQVSKNGAAWMPVLGMGIWPHQPPPLLWSKEEFENLVPGEIPRPPVFMVFRLKGQRLDNVLPLMGGRGALIQLGIQGDPEEFYRRCELHFRNFITEPLHSAYPFFFPLIDVGTLPSLELELTERILGTVTFYLRESPENGGVFILSRLSLKGCFENLGWQVVHHERVA